MYLTRHVEKVAIETTYGDSSALVQGQESVQPVGFSPEESLLPYTDYSFPGYRVLQEYFAYPRKFFFFDLLGFEKFQPSGLAESFDVRISFHKPFPIDKRFTTDNFRLQCTPIVNLFPSEAQPITMNHESTEYRINAQEGCEVYSLNTVEGIVNSTLEKRIYVPFYSFKHGLRPDRSPEQPNGYYHTTTRLITGIDSEGQPETRQNTYVAVVLPDAEADKLSEETLSLAIACTNGRWARELKEGSISNPISESRVPEFVRFRNLTQPTLILYPPLQKDLEWSFISHLALNYLSINNVEAMRGILELYDWSIERGHREVNQKHISGIRDITAGPQDIIYQDSVIRGTNVKMEIGKEDFADEGDIHLFGLVMEKFLESYAAINSFTQLTLVSHDSKEELFRWIPRITR